MKIVSCYLFIATSLLLASCSHTTTVADGERFASEIRVEDLKAHLRVLASDSLEGREFATDGERKASAFISGEFSSLGLSEPAGTKHYLEEFFALHDSITAVRLDVDGTSFDQHEVDVWPYLTLNSDSTFTAHSFVFAGYGIDDSAYSDYAKLGSITLNGKVVVVLDDEPKTDSTTYLITHSTKRSRWSRRGAMFSKMAVARMHGARALIIIDTNLESEIAFRKFVQYSERFRTSTADTAREPFNIFGVSATPAKKILGWSVYNTLPAAEANPSQLVPIEIKRDLTFSFHKNVSRIPVHNVVGYVEGTDKKNEYVIVSAHYDHLGKHDGKIWHGADDNGSGTCGLLGIAKAFSAAAAAGLRPHRTVVFLSVTGEEKGLLGSSEYVTHPLFPLDSTVADVNTDMIGRVDTLHPANSNYLYIIGDDKLSSELRPIDERNDSLHEHLTLDYTYNAPNDPNRFYYRSDHYNFAQHKIPIIFYFDGMHPDYHQPTDTYDKINYELMQKRAQLAFYTAWEIANRENKLKVDKNGD